MNIWILSLMIFIMTISGTFGALFFKRAISKQQGLNLFRLALTPSLYIGGVCYVLGASTNIILLRYMDYSVIYPMTSLTYIWTMIVSYLVLGEKITREKVFAVLFIVAGVVFLNIK